MPLPRPQTTAPSAAPTAAVANVAPKPQQAPTIKVTVERGDTLWSIAEQHLGAGERWREIAELNRGREMSDGSTFDDARTILPGWTLLVPSSAPRPVAEHVVTVERGDTLWELADDAYGEGSKWPRVYEANAERIEDPHWIHPGQQLVVPGQRAWSPAEGRGRPPASASTGHPGHPACRIPPTHGKYRPSLSRSRKS